MPSIKSPLEHERRQAKACGDLSSPGHISGPPKLAPLERLPKRHRVGPSASLDEYRTINYCGSVSQAGSHVNFTHACRARGIKVFSFVQPGIKSCPVQPSLHESDDEGLPGFGRDDQSRGWQGEAGFPSAG